MSKIAKQKASEYYPYRDGKLYDEYRFFQRRIGFSSGYDQSAKDTIARIKNEIERRMTQWHATNFIDEMKYGGQGNGFLDFLSELEKEYSNE